jgi:predicted GNAT family acetyltransferase
MSSMYAKYLTERTNDQILETNQGFATYRILPDQTVYIVDIFVETAFRKSGLAAEIADEIAKLAKKAGCTKMLGSVVPSTKGSTTSMAVLLGYGMKLQSSTNDFILFEKDL